MVARHAVGAIAAAAFALLIAIAPRYGWHRDELYFLECGHHLAWGFVDQPPFTPAVARLAEIIRPGNLTVLRLLPALATVATINLGACIVRELGGLRGAQIAGAAATAAGGFVLGVGHLLATEVFDLTAWLVLLLIVIRLLGRDDPRWWFAFGAVAGVAMLNKNLIVLLSAALAIGMIAERRWALVRTPMLFGGAALALLIAAPNLVWQAQHGWPQLDMARVLSARLATENRLTMLPLQVLFVGPALIPLLWRGGRWLARDEAGHAFRPMLWAWPAGVIAALVTGGRPYYVVPFTMTVMLAGVVATAGRGSIRRLAMLIIPNALISAVIALPLLPTSSINTAANLNEAVAETVGWPQLTRQIAGVVATLPPRERASVILLAGSYGEAGALDLFGPRLGLHQAYSPHNAYAYFRRPTDARATVVSVRLSRTFMLTYFRACESAGVVDNGFDVENEVQGAPILVCRGLRRPWSETWERMRFLG